MVVSSEVLHQRLGLLGFLGSGLLLLAGSFLASLLGSGLFGFLTFFGGCLLSLLALGGFLARLFSSFFAIFLGSGLLFLSSCLFGLLGWCLEVILHHLVQFWCHGLGFAVSITGSGWGSSSGSSSLLGLLDLFLGSLESLLGLLDLLSSILDLLLLSLDGGLLLLSILLGLLATLFLILLDLLDGLLDGFLGSLGFLLGSSHGFLSGGDLAHESSELGRNAWLGCWCGLGWCSLGLSLLLDLGDLLFGLLFDLLLLFWIGLFGSLCLGLSLHFLGLIVSLLGVFSGVSRLGGIGSWGSSWLGGISSWSSWNTLKRLLKGLSE